MKTLIIGNGEIGRSLANVLSVEYSVDVIDKGEEKDSLYDIIHVCFPYSESFVNDVIKYQEKYQPKYTVIHSTVPVGTCRKCNAISSPVNGRHPLLEESLKLFVKFLGGEQASEVADYFKRAKIEVYITDKQETTELMKILCTTYYAVNIEYTKQVKRECDKYGVPFELWTIWNENYNDGYEKMGFRKYVRQNLVPIMKKQGGHCTVNNCSLLDNVFTRFIKEMNK